MLSRARPIVAKAASFTPQCRIPRYGDQQYSSSTSYRGDQPLHILFCGSDDFSIVALRALYHYSKLSSSNVATIDVATRTDKRTGRGMREFTSPPLKHAAEQLMLPVHQFNTFRGWNLPTLGREAKSYINMVIAVSFGLFVPPRILNQCEFGGLNVHPSMLPDLKGSAPIEYTVLNGYQRTGVTIQTLHPSTFDEGNIVLQTPMPGLTIPDPDHITAPQLKEMLADIGADLLVRSLQERLYLRPMPRSNAVEDRTMFKMAPKLTSESRHVDFSRMTSVQILRLKRALGDLWAKLDSTSGKRGLNSDTRLTFSSSMRLARKNETADFPSEVLAAIEPGRPFCLCLDREDIRTLTAPLFVKAADEVIISLPEITVSGSKPGNGSAAVARMNLLDEAVSLPGSEWKLHNLRTKLI